MQLVLILSDFISGWMYVTGLLFTAAIAVLLLARSEGPFIPYPVAIAVRYGLMTIAAIVLLIVAASFFSTGKGLDRLAHIGLVASLWPIWLLAFAAFLLPPRKL